MRSVGVQKDDGAKISKDFRGTKNAPLMELERIEYGVYLFKEG